MPGMSVASIAMRLFREPFVLGFITSQPFSGQVFTVLRLFDLASSFRRLWGATMGLSISSMGLDIVISLTWVCRFSSCSLPSAVLWPLSMDASEIINAIVSFSLWRASCLGLLPEWVFRWFSSSGELVSGWLTVFLSDRGVLNVSAGRSMSLRMDRSIVSCLGSNVTRPTDRSGVAVVGVTTGVLYLFVRVLRVFGVSVLLGVLVGIGVFCGGIFSGGLEVTQLAFSKSVGGLVP